MIKKFLIVAGITSLFFSLSPIALAGFPADGFPVPTPFSNVGGFANFVVNKLGSFLFTVLVSIAAILIIYAAYIYLTSEGEPEKNKKALNTLIYALLAIVVAIISRSVVYMVLRFFCSTCVLT